MTRIVFGSGDVARRAAEAKAKREAMVAKAKQEAKIRYTVSIPKSVLEVLEDEAADARMKPRELIRKHLELHALAHKNRKRLKLPHPYRKAEP